MRLMFGRWELWHILYYVVAHLLKPLMLKKPTKESKSVNLLSTKILVYLKMLKIWYQKCYLSNQIKDYLYNKFWFILSWQAIRCLNRCQLQYYIKLQPKQSSNKMASYPIVPLNLYQRKQNRKFNPIWIVLNHRKVLAKGCYCVLQQVSIEIYSITGKIQRKICINSRVARRWSTIIILINLRIQKLIWDRI